MNTTTTAPPGAKFEDRRLALIIAPVFSLVLAIAVMIVRVAARRMKKIALRADDYFIIAALVPACAHTIVATVIGITHGLGRHIWDAPADALHGVAMASYIADIGHLLTIALVKASVFAFYWRLFGSESIAQIPIGVVGGFVALWSIVIIVVTVNQCNPVNAFWDRFNPVSPMRPSEFYCHADGAVIFRASGIATIVINVFLFFLPVRYVPKLRLSKRQKIALGCIFVASALAIVVSGIQLLYRMRIPKDDSDPTWNLVNLSIWTKLEATTAVICACLPFIRPFIVRLQSDVLRLGSVLGRQESRENLATDAASIPPAPQTSIPPEGATHWTRPSVYGENTTTVRSYGRAQDGYPFAQLANWSQPSISALSHASTHASSHAPSHAPSHASNASNRSRWSSFRFPRNNNNNDNFIELDDMPPVNRSPPGGILVTKEVSVTHEDAASAELEDPRGETME